MQAKIFLSSLLATLLAVGVTATPAGFDARDIKSTHSLDLIATPFQEVAKDLGIKKPRPNGAIITPKDGDVPVPSSVKARDLESLEKRTPGCLYVTSDPNFGGNHAYLCPIATNGGCTAWDVYWRYSISSFGPDDYTICQIFTSTDCSSGGSTPFGYPGYGNLGGWDNNMGSFICWW
ncbi:hypothetical protein B9Z19DRAFT_1089580 [Tuber borchii]|uniref:Uncharacterized protein n=1 Tax=Tuber borchii TaxID=42251 RepID=A0A2T6ZJZ0_TUBBO|nr:hypothetical protein B9Z19DRAFT_1089580 [Tuber borchii]